MSEKSCFDIFLRDTEQDDDDVEDEEEEKKMADEGLQPDSLSFE